MNIVKKNCSYMNYMVYLQYKYTWTFSVWNFATTNYTNPGNRSGSFYQLLFCFFLWNEFWLQKKPERFPRLG